MHACGQLELIKKHLDELHEGELSEINLKLKDIALKLQYTYNFVEIMTSCFELFMEGTINLSSFMMPITFYQLIESTKRGAFSIEVSSFVIASFLMSSIPSYFSDQLLEKGEDVSTALYTCGWERHYDKRERSTILLLLIRTSRPVALRTMFRTLCLDSLTDMFQRAYAIFNLMNAVLE
ncbi:uncharacterized protein LOC142983995 [Anticarsia gemmatalis]|uniref:uncharacterized protein LOC142983995 n=1 Tax=Anticarsia gemmatalis TaxID=129554 RepID=UPI003F7637B2